MSQIRILLPILKADNYLNILYFTKLDQKCINNKIQYWWRLSPDSLNWNVRSSFWVAILSYHEKLYLHSFLFFRFTLVNFSHLKTRTWISLHQWWVKYSQWAGSGLPIDWTSAHGRLTIDCIWPAAAHVVCRMGLGPASFHPGLLMPHSCPCLLNSLGPRQCTQLPRGATPAPSSSSSLLLLLHYSEQQAG